MYPIISRRMMGFFITAPDRSHGHMRSNKSTESGLALCADPSCEKTCKHTCFGADCLRKTHNACKPQAVEEPPCSLLAQRCPALSDMLKNPPTPERQGIPVPHLECRQLLIAFPLVNLRAVHIPLDFLKPIYSVFYITLVRYIVFDSLLS